MKRRYSTAKITTTKHFLQKIIDAPNVGIGVLKAVRNSRGEIKDFRFEFINRRTAEAFGSINPVGTLLSDYGAEGTEQLEYFREVIETGRENSYTKRMNSNIARGWYLFSNAPLGDDRLIQVWEDITKLKETEEELLRLKDQKAQKARFKYLMLFHSIDQGVAHCKFLRDEKGNARMIIVDEVNAAWEKIMGINPERVLGKSISEWLPNLDGEWIEFCQRVLDTGSPERYEAQVSDLGSKWFEVFLVPLDNDYFMALCTDTTTRRQAQETLEKAVALREEFISIASHELRTPLTSLKIYLQFLEKYYVRKDINDKKRIYYRKINEQIDRLNTLVNDLLDVSRIQSGKLEFVYPFFDINEIVEEVREVMQMVAKKQKIVVHGKITKDIYADKGRITQVITNLLINAIKYAPNTKKIVIHLIPEVKHALVQVEDFGIGIDTEHKEKLFHRFYRVTNEYGKTFPGLGMGLYISNEIV